jgi:hypothetical protein
MNSKNAHLINSLYTATANKLSLNSINKFDSQSLKNIYVAKSI